MIDPEKAAAAFKVLSVGTRVRMLELLKKQALCVNALSAKLKITAAATSQHLRVLRDAKLVTAERRGYFVHYRVNEKALAQLQQLAMAVLESGE